MHDKTSRIYDWVRVTNLLDFLHDFEVRQEYTSFCSSLHNFFYQLERLMQGIIAITLEIYANLKF